MNASINPSEQPDSEIPAVFAGEVIAITGTLASMTHEQAFAQILQFGGQPSSHMSRQITMLIIGEEGWPLESDGKPSVKLQQAEMLLKDGITMRIVRESDWLRMMHMSVDEEDVKRLYTPAMLSQLLDVPVHIIRGWERAGLIRAEKRIFRLPYFSYQDVVTARRLSELVQAGATQAQITRSLSMLGKYLDQPGRILEQLEVLSEHQMPVLRDRKGYIDPQSRQRLFRFDAEPSAVPDSQSSPVDDDDAPHVLSFTAAASVPRTSTDWMVEGCRQAEYGDTTSAIRSFRKALRIRPDDAEAHFHLADSLYRLGKPEAALERYLAAIEHDPEYVEAWVQIGCLYANLHRYTEALSAFDCALEIHPTFAEAHLQKAETLFQLHQPDDAIPHWKAYLQQDQRGPWAELAYSRLERLGMEVE